MKNINDMMKRFFYLYVENDVLLRDEDCKEYFIDTPVMKAKLEKYKKIRNDIVSFIDSNEKLFEYTNLNSETVQKYLKVDYVLKDGDLKNPYYTSFIEKLSKLKEEVYKLNFKECDEIISALNTISDLYVKMCAQYVHFYREMNTICKIKEVEQGKYSHHFEHLKEIEF